MNGVELLNQYGEQRRWLISVIPLRDAVALARRRPIYKTAGLVGRDAPSLPALRLPLMNG